MSPRTMLACLAVVLLGACAPRPPVIPSVATDTPSAGPSRTPRLTAEPATPGVPAPPTLTPSGPPPTPWPTPVTNAPVIPPLGFDRPLPSNDPFLQEMRLAGYSLFQSGAIPLENGSAFAAYVFTRLELGEPVGADTFVLAFYRWEGDTPHPLGTAFPSAYSLREPVSPTYYRLANWDDPATALMGLTRIADPDPQTRQLLHLDGHAADINANGRPEFTFGGEYCPVSCGATVQSYDFFEVSEDGVARLGAELPGHLGLIPASLDPLIFEVTEAIPYGAGAQIVLPAFAEWNGEAFETVTHRNADLFDARLAEHRARLEADYGKPFGRDELSVAAYSLLLLYEHLGQRQQGLEVFLEVTDPRHWAGENPRVNCWLQLSRARAREELARSQPFTLLPPLSEFDPNIDVPRLMEPLTTTADELNACERWRP